MKTRASAWAAVSLSSVLTSCTSPAATPTPPRRDAVAAPTSSAAPVSTSVATSEDRTLPPVPPQRRVTKIAAGGWTTCALLEGGAVNCVRHGTSASVGLDDAIDVGVGDGFACALSSKGQVSCWGNGHDGVLGNGDTADGSNGRAASLAEKPAVVEGLSPIRKLFVGAHNVCVLDEQARASCWGANQSGQLGNGTRVDRGRPVRVSGLDGATALAIATHEICALTAKARVECVNEDGSVNEYSPLRGAVTLSAGDKSLCAALEDGTARCWEEIGRAGATVRLGGKTVQDLGPVSDIQRDSDDGHTCALGRDGGVYCWGHNLAGELGQCTSKKADFYESKKPLRVPGIDGAKQIAVAPHRSCALLSDGSTRCWGMGKFGELADGAFRDSPAPRLTSFDPARPPHCVPTAMGNPIGSAKAQLLASSAQSIDLELAYAEDRVCYRVDKAARASVAIACPGPGTARQALPAGVVVALRRNDDDDERAGDVSWIDEQGKRVAVHAPRCQDPAPPTPRCP